MLWEKGQATGPVIYDEKNQTFRMYYHGVENCICVLESPDGIEWTRPHLGLVPFHGERFNNIANWPDDWNHPVRPT